MGTQPWQPGGGPADRAGNGRRDFLRLAGAAATAGALSACLPPHGARGTAGQGTRPAAARRGGAPAPSRLASAPSAADWQALRRALSTARLLRPGEPGYGRARLLYDPRFDGLRPAAVAYAASAADVATCLDFVRRFGLPTAARSGGHSYAGWSSTPGLIIDVTGLSGFVAAPAGRSVSAGSGLRLIDFYHRLSGHGLAVPGGSCPTVGLAGLTLGGGVGVTGRAHGLTCDNLTAVQIVTADGGILDCDESHHADLFWACRGGGGGNFGVATSFTFRARPLTRLALFFLSWPWDQAGPVIGAWQRWAPHAPDELWSNLHLSATPGGGPPAIQVGGTFLGPPTAAAPLLEDLYAAVGSAPSSVYLAGSGYLEAMLAEAGCPGMTVDQCHLPGQAPGGRFPRVPSFAKSDFFTRPLPAAAIAALLGGVERLAGARAAAAGATGGVALDAFGGALNRPGPQATAFVHRDALFLAQYTTEWAPGAHPAGVARQRRWLRSFYASMRGHASGQCYQNYLDPDLTDWRAAYYGANYQRLAEVKAAYDPGRVFRFPQGVTPAR